MVEFFGDPDILEIRKTFLSIDACREWEHRVLKRMRVIYRDDFLNKTDNKSICPKLSAAYNKGKIPWNKGKKLPTQSEESNLKRSKTLKEYYKDKPGNRKGHSPWCAGTTGLVKAWNKGKKMPTITCPYCGKVGDEANMKRWHFDNCKHNPNRIYKPIDKLFWISNGIQSKMVKESILVNYLSNGYWLGRK